MRLFTVFGIIWFISASSGDEVRHIDNPDEFILPKMWQFESPKNVDEYLSKKVLGIMAARIFTQNFFQLMYTDGTTLQVQDWVEMGLWLQHYHEPFRYMLLQSLDIDREAMDFFRGMDRRCFLGITLAFNSVFFNEAVDDAWLEELFGGSDAILRPSEIQLSSVRGFDSERFEKKFLRYDSFRLSRKIVLLDDFQLQNMSYVPDAVRSHCLKISTESIIRWLHDDEGFALNAGGRVFNVQVELLKDTPVVVIEKVFETFLADTDTASYTLLIYRPSKSGLDIASTWPTHDVHGNGEDSGQSAKNPITGETMRVRLLNQDGYVEVESETGKTSYQIALPGDDLFLERYSGDDKQSLWNYLRKMLKDMKGKKITPVVIHQ